MAFSSTSVKKFGSKSHLFRGVAAFLLLLFVICRRHSIRKRLVGSKVHSFPVADYYVHSKPSIQTFIKSNISPALQSAPIMLSNISYMKKRLVLPIFFHFYNCHTQKQRFSLSKRLCVRCRIAPINGVLSAISIGAAKYTGTVTTATRTDNRSGSFNMSYSNCGSGSNCNSSSAVTSNYYNAEYWSSSKSSIVSAARSAGCSSTSSANGEFVHAGIVTTDDSSICAFSNDEGISRNTDKTATTRSSMVRLVRDLRSRSGGAAVNVCRKALLESNLDVDTAFKWLLREGYSSRGNKLSNDPNRSTKEGVIGINISNIRYVENVKTEQLKDTKRIVMRDVGTIVELNSQTDFVGKNESVTKFMRRLLSHINAIFMEYNSSLCTTYNNERTLFTDLSLYGHTASNNATDIFANILKNSTFIDNVDSEQSFGVFSSTHPCELTTGNINVTWLLSTKISADESNTSCQNDATAPYDKRSPNALTVKNELSNLSCLVGEKLAIREIYFMAANSYSRMELESNELSTVFGSISESVRSSPAVSLSNKLDWNKSHFTYHNTSADTIKDKYVSRMYNLPYHPKTPLMKVVSYSHTPYLSATTNLPCRITTSGTATSPLISLCSSTEVTVSPKVALVCLSNLPLRANSRRLNISRNKKAKTKDSTARNNEDDLLRLLDEPGMCQGEAMDIFTRVGEQLAMHLLVSNPLSLNIASLPSWIIEKELACIREEAYSKIKGKSEAEASQIINGKLDNFYRKNVLLEQVPREWALDDTKRSVRQVLEDFRKEYNIMIDVYGYKTLSVPHISSKYVK